MLNFEPLASSSASCAYRLSGGGATRPLLIDCGVPFKQLQKLLDFRVAELEACLISHAHGDHCKAVYELMRRSIDCCASRETWGALSGEMPCSYYKIVVEPQQSCAIGDWMVTPFESVHDTKGALGFIIDSPEHDRLLYLTDSAYSKHKFTNLTHIAIEANHSMEIMRDNVESGKISQERFNRTAHTHMAIERTVELLKANDLSKVQQIWLLHLSSENSDSDEFKNLVERATGVPTFVATR